MCFDVVVRFSEVDSEVVALPDAVLLCKDVGLDDVTDFDDDVDLTSLLLVVGVSTTIVPGLVPYGGIG